MCYRADDFTKPLERLMAAMKEKPMPHEPTARQKANARRIDSADKALRSFLRASGGEYGRRPLETLPPGEQADVLTDLLTNLRHWCHAEDADFERAVRLSRDHFNEESDEVDDDYILPGTEGQDRESYEVTTETASAVGDKCSCEESGHWNSGLPGVLAHVANGAIALGTSVERCDVCKRFATDEDAELALRDHLSALAAAQPVAWCIDRDNIAEGGWQSRKGRLFGPRQTPLLHRWRVKAADGEVYYEGRCSVNDSFAPLDFAQADAGATDIEYLDPATGRWVGL